MQLCDWDTDRFDLDWKFPKSDGGAAIQHYLVEMRRCKKDGSPDSEWEQIGQSDGPKRFYSATGFQKGDKVQFRARSVNKGGVSEPSEPTPVLTARPRRAPPVINRDQVLFNKITILDLKNATKKAKPMSYL